MTLAAARTRAERINMRLINTFSARRALIGRGRGARGVAGAARAAMELVTITETIPARAIGGKALIIDITESGMRTARRRVPVVLSRMDGLDVRRRAADRYAVAVEKIGSMAGVSAEGQKVDGGQGSNDGGITTRILHASVISTVEGSLAKACDALVPGRGPGARRRRAISARELVDAICLEGRDMKAILTRAGWSGQRRDVATLSRKAEDCLEDMARALGMIPADAPRP